MNADGSANVVCWNCIKGRHAICTGVVEDSDKDDAGKRCECPVCHANRHANRQPVYDANRACYYDPGPIFEKDEV